MTTVSNGLSLLYNGGKKKKKNILEPHDGKQNWAVHLLRTFPVISLFFFKNAVKTGPGK